MLAMSKRSAVDVSDELFTISMLIYSASLYDYYSWSRQTIRDDYFWNFSADIANFIITFVGYVAIVGLFVAIMRSFLLLASSKRRKLIRQKTKKWFSSGTADSPWITALYVFMGMLLVNVPLSVLSYVLLDAICYGMFVSFLVHKVCDFKSGHFSDRKIVKLLKPLSKKFKKLGPQVPDMHLGAENSPLSSSESL
jgi:hypothetical protein